MQPAFISNASSRVFIAAGIFLGVLYVYLLYMESLGSFGTHYTHLHFIELALVLYLFGLVYSLLRPGRWRGVLAAIPVLLLYIVNDVFYLVYGKVFRLVNISELPELIEILPASYSIAVVLILLMPFVLILKQTNYTLTYRPVLAWFSPLLFLLLAISLFPAGFAHGFKNISNEIVKYSDGKSVENNGRLSMLLYREAERINTLNEIMPYRQREAYQQQLDSLVSTLGKNLNRQNVHLVVLESFLDPRLFDKLKFSESPVHPDFEALFANRLGLSIAPVFGGATAQSEFEVLCGVPAFEKLSSVEFNVFTGTHTGCLPALLSQLDYRVVASNAYKPSFFNALPAYTGMGFDEKYFPREFYGLQPSYLQFGKVGVEEYLFDSELFRQNLVFVKQHLTEQPGKPLFNYMMTIYGHTPHALDPGLRPEIIKTISSYPDDHLSRAVNQFYYRTQAIASYVRQLQAIDPHSLIILMADHVPPLRNGPNTYKALHYMGNRENSYYYNPIAIINDGKALRFPVIHHYDVPALIMAQLSNGSYCETHYCAHAQNQPARSRDDYMEDYLRLMAHASE